MAKLLLYVTYCNYIYKKKAEVCVITIFTARINIPSTFY